MTIPQALVGPQVLVGGSRVENGAVTPACRAVRSGTVDVDQIATSQPIGLMRSPRNALMVRTPRSSWCRVDKLLNEMITVFLHHDRIGPAAERDCGGSGQVADGCVRPIGVRYWRVEGGSR